VRVHFKLRQVNYSPWDTFGFYNRLERGQQKPDWRSEVAEAEKIRDEVWRDHALEMVKSAMPKNWVAAMTYLERKYPNEFALRTVNRNLNSTDQPIGDKVDEEQLRRYAGLIDQFRRENESKAPAQTPALPSP
jgi:hypothetical protein